MMSFYKMLQTGQDCVLQSATLHHNLLMEKQRRGLFIILHYSFHRNQRYCTNIEKAQKGYGDTNCCISDYRQITFSQRHRYCTLLCSTMRPSPISYS